VSGGCLDGSISDLGASLVGVAAAQDADKVRNHSGGVYGSTVVGMHLLAPSLLFDFECPYHPVVG